MKKILVWAMVLLIPSISFAAMIKTDESVSLDAQTKNIYVFSSNINAKEDIKGDAVLFGQNINIDKNVEHSLFAFGNGVDIAGNIGQSVRTGANTVNISGIVGEDALVGASALTIAESAVVKGDLLAGTASSNIKGTIEGNVKIAASKVVLSGKILGNVDIEANEIIIADNAEIGGALNYWSGNPGMISPDAKIASGPYYNHIETDYAQTSSSMAYAFLSLIILALAITYGFRRFCEPIGKSNFAFFARNCGWGLLMIGAIPVASFILFAISVHLGFTALVAYIMGLLVAYAVSAIYTGFIVQKILSKEKEFEISWVTVLIGSVVFILIGYIPYIGSTIKFVLYLSSFGYIMNKIYNTISFQSAKNKSAK